MEKVRYMISDAANIVNVESHVLRYWEEELGLAVPRNEMGHRYYTEENIAQFQKIKQWKEEGYQLKAIRIMIHNGGAEIPEQSMLSMQPAQVMQQNQSEWRMQQSQPEHMMQQGQPERMMQSGQMGQPEPFVPSMQMVQPVQSGAVQMVQSVNAEQSMPSVHSGQPMAMRQMQSQYAAVPQEKERAEGGKEGRMVIKQQENAASNTVKLEQFHNMMLNIVKRAVEENNQALGKQVGEQVGEQVLKEMNYLFREQDETEEERFRKLDAAIRARPKGRFSKKEKPEKVKKGFGKNKKLSPNATV